MKKITLNKLWGYNIFGIGVIGVKGKNTVMINYREYNIDDLGVGPINWLKKYASNCDNIHSNSIRRMLLENKKY